MQPDLQRLYGLLHLLKQRELLWLDSRYQEVQASVLWSIVAVDGLFSQELCSHLAR